MNLPNEAARPALPAGLSAALPATSPAGAAAPPADTITLAAPSPDALAAAPAPAGARHLLILARRPELGQVKTRLAQHIGPAAALAVYEELLARTRAAADGVAARKTLWLASAAPPTGAEQPLWPGYAQQPQPAGDLGARLAAGFRAAFAAGATAALVIGTDCPALSTELLEQAFEQLATHDVVLGPAADGGYYLLGMKVLHPELFANKPWSTAAVLAATLADARRLGLRVAQLPVLRDVDTAADLAAWRGGEGS